MSETLKHLNRGPSGSTVSSQAWDRLLEALAGYGAAVETFANPLDRAEGLRHGLRLLTHLLELRIERQDPLRPEFFRPVSPIRKFWADGVDVDYQTAVIAPQYEYRVFGNKGSVPYFAALVNRGGSKQERVADNFLITPEHCDDAGNFEFFISTDLRGRPGLKMDEHCVDVVMREYHFDRQNETAASFDIEIVGTEVGPRPPLDEAWLAKELALTAKGLEVNVKRELRALENVRRRPNEVGPIEEGRGWSDFFGTTSNQYLAGWFELEEGESLVMTFDPPECLYFGITLYNSWFESLEYRDRTVNLGTGDLVRDSDGRITVTIGGDPEGVTNWLDPAGHAQGGILVRHLEAQSQPVAPHVEVKR